MTQEVITVFKKNSVWMKIICDEGIKLELLEHFKFRVKNYMFTPLYKQGIWDGYKKLFNPMKSDLHHGLFSELKRFCEERDYRISLENSDYGYPGETTDYTKKDICEFVDSLDIHSNGVKITPHDYQYDAIYQAIHKRNLVLLSPTSSGKSLIIHAIARFAETLHKRILIICPTKQLVEQMYTDFADYTSNDSAWGVSDHAHKIYAGFDKHTNASIVISTWQSIYNLESKYFTQFGCVICDETHLAKGDSISSILGGCSNANMRIGLTGSLDDSHTNKMVIQGLLGDIYTVATSRELIDKGHLTDIKISAIMLNYSDNTKKDILSKKKSEDKFSYSDEIDFLVSHKKRNTFLIKLALSRKGNVLLLFNLEKHGKELYKIAQERNTGKKIFYIDGKVDVDYREAARAALETSEEVAIIASVKTTSTGVNTKNLKHLIFATPSKSVVQVLQSIGRGLRKAKGKTHVEVYDIGDLLTKSRKKTNYTHDHFVQRLEIYARQDFEYRLMEMEIE